MRSQPTREGKIVKLVIGTNIFGAPRIYLEMERLKLRLVWNGEATYDVVGTSVRKATRKDFAAIILHEAGL